MSKIGYFFGTSTLAFLLSFGPVFGQIKVPKDIKKIENKIPKGKDEKKAEDKKEESKKVDEKKTDDKKTSDGENKNTTTPVNTKPANNTKTTADAEGPVPKTSKAYIPWTNYDRNFKLAQKSETEKDFNKLKDYVKYCEKFIKEMKTKDASLDYSQFENETAQLKKISDEANANADAANQERENKREQIRSQIPVYYNLYETQDDFNMSSRSNNQPIKVSGKEYLKLATSLEKENLTKSLNEWLVDNPKDQSMLDFKKRLDDYENYIEYSGILKHSTKIAEGSYDLVKQKNVPKALEAIEEAKGYCEGVLKLSPNNAKAKETLVFIDKAYNNANANAAKEFTSSFHKQNVNKIVFSKKPLTIGSENLSDVTTTFTSNDEIYGTIYFSDKLINLLESGTTKFRFDFLLNDETVHIYDPHITLTEESKQKSYLQFVLVPDESYSFATEVKGYNETVRLFNDKIISKGPLTHKITFESEIGKTDEQISGTFNYDISGGTTKNEKVKLKAEDVFASAVRLPTAKMNNPQLLAQMTELVNKYAGKGEKYAYGRIASSDWTINKNDLGIIIDRSISGYFVGSFPDGHCEMVGFSFSQEYAGAGTYSSKLSMMLTPAVVAKMKCENASK